MLGAIDGTGEGAGVGGNVGIRVGATEGAVVGHAAIVHVSSTPVGHLSGMLYALYGR
jgi:hypothetical protein